MADGQILDTMISQSRQSASYVVLKEILSVEPIAIMLTKGDAPFKRMVDDSIVKMAKNGDIAKLYDKWFNQPIPPDNVMAGLPTSPMTKAAWVEPSDKPLEDYLKK